METEIMTDLCFKALRALISLYYSEQIDMKTLIQQSELKLRYLNEVANY
jgi:hypothetical protein